MSNRLLVLIGAAQFADAEDGGQFMYSSDERRMLRDWDIHIVDPTVIPAIMVRDISNVNNLLTKYKSSGFSKDKFINESFDQYFFNFDYMSEYDNVVFISYTCEVSDIINIINEDRNLPAFTFGHSDGKINIDTLREALADYDRLGSRDDVNVRLFIDEIMGTACMTEKTSDGSNIEIHFRDNDNDIRKYNEFVDRLQCIDCSSLNVLDYAYVQHAISRLNDISVRYLYSRRDPRNPRNALGDRGRIKHKICENEIYQYIPLDQLGGKSHWSADGEFQHWFDRQIESALQPHMVEDYELTPTIVGVSVDQGISNLFYDIYEQNNGDDLEDDEIYGIFADFLEQFEL